MFASNVSHELRTPLAAIMGELGLALQKERTPEDYQGRISRALDDVSVIANRYLLALAFRNLIENNCKYSSDHTSNVAIGVQKGLSITFADNGIGMTLDEQHNLFRMFYRGSNHVEGGHGIGMALVQRIMVLHNASIDVQSKEGHGTRFTISFTNKN